MKKKLFVLFLLFCITITTLFSKDILRVAWYTLPGFSFNVDGKKNGYNYEILQTIAKYTDSDIQYIYGTWSECLNYLKEGKADIIISVANTEEREEMFNFSKIPIGIGTSLILTSLDNSNYAYHDFDSLNNKTIGAEKNSFVNKQLEEIATKKNININIVEYPSEFDLLEALDNDELDLICVSDSNATTNYKLIAECPPYPFYIAIRKNAPEIEDKIEDALAQIYQTNPSFNQELKDKYFNSNAINARLNLTKNEIEYINSNPTIYTYYDKDFAPLGYENSKGEYKGVIPQMLDSISEKTNLKFTLVSTPSYDFARDAVKRTPSSIILDLFSDFSWGEINNVNLSTPYLYLPRVQIMLNTFSGQVKTVGVIESYYTNPKTIEQRGYVIKKYKNFDLCLDALRKGEIDATITNLYNAENLTIGTNNKDLLVISDAGFSQNLSIGINKDSPSELFSIINKAINTIEQDKLNAILTENINYKYNPIYFILQTNSLLIVTIFTLILFLSVIVILISVKRHQENKNKDIIEKAKNDAISANKSKTLFLSSMSHDLRTPINAISGMTQLALDDLDNKNLVEESFNIINKSAKHLLQIINDILEISKIENNTIAIVNKKINLKDSINYVIERLKVIAKDKKINLFVSYDLQYTYYYIDENILNRIIENIINNSIKFTDENGEIKVKVSDSNKESTQSLKISISDNGIGMTKAETNHIFESFYRVQRIKSEGTGLGLSIVYRFINALNGTIKVKSTLHKGSNFIIEIPISHVLDKDIEEQKTIEEKEAKTEPLKNKKILLVEDNRINQLVATKMIEKLGAQVIAANNGQTGYELFVSDKSINLICLDIQMPILDGYQTAKLIRKIDNHIPIIGMSANAFQSDIQKAYDNGFTDYIAKPIDFHTLKNLLSKYL